VGPGRASPPGEGVSHRLLLPLAKVELPDAVHIDVLRARRIELWEALLPDRPHGGQQLEAAECVLTRQVRALREPRGVIPRIVESYAAVTLQERLSEAYQPLDALQRVPTLQDQRGGARHTGGLAGGSSRAGAREQRACRVITGWDIIASAATPMKRGRSTCGGGETERVCTTSLVMGMR
jgi:hypothetical protein